MLLTVLVQPKETQQSSPALYSDFMFSSPPSFSIYGYRSMLVAKVKPQGMTSGNFTGLIGTPNDKHGLNRAFIIY